MVVTQSTRACVVAALLVPALAAFTAPAHAVEESSTTLAAKPQTRTQKILHAVRIAKRQVGDPYVYGAAGPHAFDCSGLTSYAYHRAGLGLSRTADQQLRQARIIPRARHRAGDLLFHVSGGSAFHVSMYVGRGPRVVEAAKPGTTVRIQRAWSAPSVVGTMR